MHTSLHSSPLKINIIKFLVDNSSEHDALVTDIASVLRGMSTCGEDVETITRPSESPIPVSSVHCSGTVVESPSGLGTSADPQPVSSNGVCVWDVDRGEATHSLTWSMCLFQIQSSAVRIRYKSGPWRPTTVPVPILGLNKNSSPSPNRQQQTNDFKHVGRDLSFVVTACPSLEILDQDKVNRIECVTHTWETVVAWAELLHCICHKEIVQSMWQG